jgi:hypothetical protein
MKIVFRFFWRNFQKENNIFFDLLSGINLDKFSSLEIHSVFVRPRKFYKLFIYLRIRFYKLRDKLSRRNRLYIWYSGELITPPSKYDLTLSFKEGSAKNLYWPLWATYLDVTNSTKKYDREFIFDQKELLTPRNISLNSKLNGKICAFISNDVAWRSDIISQLEEYGCIDLFGARNGKMMESKYDVASNYAFQLCFENIISDGYVTEKPIEAWLCGNIPIYAGGDTFGYLNKSAMIDCSKTPIASIPSFILEEITLRKENYLRINEPILSKKFDFTMLRQSINKI